MLYIEITMFRVYNKPINQTTPIHNKKIKSRRCPTWQSQKRNLKARFRIIEA